MSCSGKVSRIFEFLPVFGAAEKIQDRSLRAAEKNKEKKMKLTALASQHSSQLVEMLCFARKKK